MPAFVIFVRELGSRLEQTEARLPIFSYAIIPGAASGSSRTRKTEDIYLYSRRDAAVADLLVGALFSRGIDVTIDRREYTLWREMADRAGEFYSTGRNCSVARQRAFYSFKVGKLGTRRGRQAQ